MRLRLIGLALACAWCACASAGQRCHDSLSDPAACGDALSDCERGDVDTCAYMMLTAKGEVWKRAAVAACQKESCFCSAIVHEGYPRTDPVIRGALANSCTGAMKNPDACNVVGLTELDAAIPVSGKEPESVLYFLGGNPAWVESSVSDAQGSHREFHPKVPLSTEQKLHLARAVEAFNAGCSHSPGTLRFLPVQAERYNWMGQDAAAFTVTTTPSDSCVNLMELYQGDVVPKPRPGVVREMVERVERQESQTDRADERHQAQAAERSRDEAAMNREIAANREAQNAQLAQSLSNMQMVGVIHPVAQAPTRAPSTAGGAPQPSVATQQPSSSPTRDADPRKQGLAACLAQDASCEYGTSAACQPSVPYSDAPWSGRGQIESQLASFNSCSDDWASVCWPRLKSRLPDMHALANLVSAVTSRRMGAAMDVQAECQDNPAPAPVEQAPAYCAIKRGDCPGYLQQALTEVYAAHRLDECLYGATFRLRRQKEKAAHDAECRRRFDGP